MQCAVATWRSIHLTLLAFLVCAQSGLAQSWSVLLSDSLCIEADSVSFKIEGRHFDTDSPRLKPISAGITIRYFTKPSSLAVPCPGSCNRIRHYATGFEIRGENGFTLTRYTDSAERTAHTILDAGKLQLDFFENRSGSGTNLISRIKTDSGYWYGEWSSTISPVSASRQTYTYVMPNPFAGKVNLFGTIPCGSWTFVKFTGDYERRIYKPFIREIQGKREIWFGLP